MDLKSTSYTTYIYLLEEGTNLYKQLQGDVSDIEGGNVASAISGWDDLSSSLGSYDDLLQMPGSGAQAFIDKVKGDAETYMQGVTFEIAQPNSPGTYIPLYSLNGQATMDPNGTIDYDSNGVATLWEAVSGQLTNLANDPADAYWDNAGGMGPGLNVPWASGGSGLSYLSEDAGSSGTAFNTLAQGSLSQWEQYIHCNTSGANANSLNQDFQV